MFRRALLLLSLAFTASSLAAGQSAPIVVSPGNSVDPNMAKAESKPEPPGPRLKPSDLDNRQALNDVTKMQLIRVMDAEFVHVRKNFPIAEKNMVIDPDGMVKPGDAQLYQAALVNGAAAKIGDRVQITNIVFP